MAIGAIDTYTTTSYISPAWQLRRTPSDTAGASRTSGTDTVSLSSQAKDTGTIAGRLPLDSLFGFETETPGVVTLEELESHGREFLAEFNSTVTSLLGQQGVDTATPIELGTAPDGSTIVTNDHPDKEAIEKFFKDNPDLGNRYRMIDNMLTAAAEGREAAKFQEAYASNPEAALARFRYLFNTHIQGTVTLSDKGANITFDRVCNANG